MSIEPLVFIVDDDPAVLKSLAALVEIAFPRVETYDSAAEFLQAYQDARPGCLVLDVVMPEMSGLELHRKLREDKIELPIIFVSGYADVQAAVEAIQGGAVDFLEKPLRKQELWDSIRKALDLDERSRSRRARREQVEQQMALLNSGEREVFDLIVKGRSNKEIAAALKLSVRTIEDRRSRLMKKLQVKSVAELVQLALVR